MRMATMPVSESANPTASPVGDSLHSLSKGERLLNAREVAAKLGVSERFVRDHTTRRLPRIPGVRLGKLIRYRSCDVDLFMAELRTQAPSHRSPYRV